MYNLLAEMTAWGHESACLPTATLPDGAVASGQAGFPDSQTSVLVNFSTDCSSSVVGGMRKQADVNQRHHRIQHQQQQEIEHDTTQE